METITIDTIIKELKAGTADNPQLLSDYLIRLSASLYTAGVMELELQISYAKKWEELRPNQKSDKSCDMTAMLTDEYKEWKKASIANKTILNCIQSIKKKLRNLEMELQSGQNY
jgi:hypothetical protein